MIKNITGIWMLFIIFTYGFASDDLPINDLVENEVKNLIVILGTKYLDNINKKTSGLTFYKYQEMQVFHTLYNLGHTEVNRDYTKDQMQELLLSLDFIIDCLAESSKYEGNCNMVLEEYNNLAWPLLEQFIISCFDLTG